MAIDLTQELLSQDFAIDAGEVESAAASSGALPDGKYHARLDGAQQKDAGGTPCWDLFFLVLTGPFAGRKPKYTLWMGTSETDRDGNQKSQEDLAEAVKKIKREFSYVATRLGLQTKKVEGTGPNAKKTYVFAKRADGTPLRDFRDLIGQSEVVIETKSRTNDFKGEKRTFTEVAKYGVWRLDEPEAKDVSKAKPGERPAVSVPSAAAASRDLSDLA
jgi:hypothetical protein